MNNNLRFPISDLAQELYGCMYKHVKELNEKFLENLVEDITIIDEPNKYEVRYNNYKKYLKQGEDLIRETFYSSFCHKTEKGYSLILTTTQFKRKKLSFSREHLEMRKQGYQHFCYPYKQTQTFVFISPSGSIKFNQQPSNKGVWLSISNIKKFPFNTFGVNKDEDIIKLSNKLLFNNKKNEWCEKHLKSDKKITTLPTKSNFTKSSYGSCSSLQHFINKIKTIESPLSYKQFIDLSFDDIYEIMSLAPIFKNPVNFIDNYNTFKTISNTNNEYRTYFDDLVKIANETDNKINFSINQSNVKEQHDKMLLENLDKMKAKIINVDEKYLILENYLPNDFKIIKNGKELLFEGLTQKHCVNTYSDKINRGECCILTTEYDEKRYTAEIHFGTSWLADDNLYVYRIQQFTGYANSRVPYELNSKLQKIIDEVNKKEKKYIKKNEELNTSLYEHTAVQVQYIEDDFEF